MTLTRDEREHVNFIRKLILDVGDDAHLDIIDVLSLIATIDRLEKELVACGNLLKSNGLSLNIEFFTDYFPKSMRKE